jgi:sulfite exporter TauE/SafE
MDNWTAFALGVFASLHCAAMCGPLALALPMAGRTSVGFVLSRVLYNLGRIATYCLLGIVFGAVGHTLFLAGIQRWVSIALGVVLLVGLFGSKKVALAGSATAFVQRLKSSMSALLKERSWMALMLLGLLNGLLPCGLVYVACAGATVSHDMVSGAQYMAAFGLGTLPMLLVIGISGRLVPVSLRLHLRKAVPVSVFLLAALLVLRGMSLGIPYISPDLSANGLNCCHK